MIIRERIIKLREHMKKHQLDLYIVPTADFHQSEHVGEHFKVREYMTGFTGSAGTAVFTHDKAGLWTDGRYFIQAEQELSGSGVELYKMFEPEVPTILEFIKAELPDGGKIGFDGRVVGTKEGEEYHKEAKEKGGKIVDVDLVDTIWTKRPALPSASAYPFEEKYSGESTSSKLHRVRDKMKEKGATVHLLTSVDDIGWLLNFRGGDIKNVPFTLAYLAVWLDRVDLYAAKMKFSPEMLQIFAQDNIHIHPYDGLYEDIKVYPASDVLLIDPGKFNYTLYASIPEGMTLLQEENPTILLKAVKNEVEVAHTRQAHIMDGVAMTKFMYWLKNHPQQETITELSAAKKIEELRRQNADCLGPSFESICAYLEHAALVHYSSSEESNVSLAGDGLFLVDSGGHYRQGSTDITRTYAIGNITDRQKEHFTLVVMGMLHLSSAQFLYGCNGRNLDYAARRPLWDRGLDYKHGTGHGVGHLGSIHEPPISIAWQKRGQEPPAFEEYMVVSNEPGIYIEGSHGIRIENELLLRKGIKNEYGQFMYFETLTFAPIDLDAINPETMSAKEKEMLNNYHQLVYDKISPYLDADEQGWLKEYTRKI